MNDYNAEALAGCGRCAGCALLLAMIIAVFTIITSMSLGD